MKLNSRLLLSVLPTVVLSILNPFGSGLWSFIIFSWLFNRAGDIVRIEGLGKWIGRVAALGGGPALGPRLELGR